jgi:hypothetical protein
MKLTDMLNDADYVVIDGVMFQTGYLRVPDEFTAADDVVLEARHGDTEVDLTREEIDDAVLLGEGVFRLKSGSLVRFLSSAVSTSEPFAPDAARTFAHRPSRRGGGARLPAGA